MPLNSISPIARVSSISSGSSFGAARAFDAHADAAASSPASSSNELLTATDEQLKAGADKGDLKAILELGKREAALAARPPVPVKEGATAPGALAAPLAHVDTYA